MKTLRVISTWLIVYAFTFSTIYTDVAFAQAGGAIGDFSGEGVEGGMEYCSGNKLCVEIQELDAKLAAERAKVYPNRNESLIASLQSQRNQKWNYYLSTLGRLADSNGEDESGYEDIKYQFPSLTTEQEGPGPNAFGPEAMPREEYEEEVRAYGEVDPNTLKPLDPSESDINLGIARARYLVTERMKQEDIKEYDTRLKKMIITLYRIIQCAAGKNKDLSSIPAPGLPGVAEHHQAFVDALKDCSDVAKNLEEILKDDLNGEKLYSEASGNGSGNGGVIHTDDQLNTNEDDQRDIDNSQIANVNDSENMEVKVSEQWELLRNEMKDSGDVHADGGEGASTPFSDFKNAMRKYIDSFEELNFPEFKAQIHVMEDLIVELEGSQEQVDYTHAELANGTLGVGGQNQRQLGDDLYKNMDPDFKKQFEADFESKWAAACGSGTICANPYSLGCRGVSGSTVTKEAARSSCLQDYQRRNAVSFTAQRLTGSSEAYEAMLDYERGTVRSVAIKDYRTKSANLFASIDYLIAVTNAKSSKAAILGEEALNEAQALIKKLGGEDGNNSVVEDQLAAVGTLFSKELEDQYANSDNKDIINEYKENYERAERRLEMLSIVVTSCNFLKCDPIIPTSGNINDAAKSPVYWMFRTATTLYLAFEILHKKDFKEILDKIKQFTEELESAKDSVQSASAGGPVGEDPDTLLGPAAGNQIPGRSAHVTVNEDSGETIQYNHQIRVLEMFVALYELQVDMISRLGYSSQLLTVMYKINAMHAELEANARNVRMAAAEFRKIVIENSVVPAVQTSEDIAREALTVGQASMAAGAAMIIMGFAQKPNPNWGLIAAGTALLQLGKRVEKKAQNTLAAVDIHDDIFDADMEAADNEIKDAANHAKLICTYTNQGGISAEENIGAMGMVNDAANDEILTRYTKATEKTVNGDSSRANGVNAKDLSTLNATDLENLDPFSLGMNVAMQDPPVRLKYLRGLVMPMVKVLRDNADMQDGTEDDRDKAREELEDLIEITPPDPEICKNDPSKCVNYCTKNPKASVCNEICTRYPAICARIPRVNNDTPPIQFAFPGVEGGKGKDLGKGAIADGSKKGGNDTLSGNGNMGKSVDMQAAVSSSSNRTNSSASTVKDQNADSSALGNGNVQGGSVFRNLAVNNRTNRNGGSSSVGNSTSSGSSFAGNGRGLGSGNNGQQAVGNNGEFVDYDALANIGKNANKDGTGDSAGYGSGAYGSGAYGDDLYGNANGQNNGRRNGRGTAGNSVAGANKNGSGIDGDGKNGKDANAAKRIRSLAGEKRIGVNDRSKETIFEIISKRYVKTAIPRFIQDP